MEKKRFLSGIILAAWMLSLTACQTKPEAPTASVTDAQTTAAVTTAKEERILPNLPERDYKGYPFRIMTNSQDYNVHWYSRDINATEETGEPINDAVYQRNRAIEEAYNIKIVAVPEKDPLQAVQKSIKAGDDAYDLVTGSLGACGLTLGVQGFFYDLREVPFLDLAKPWYDQPAQEQLSIGKKLYATTTDMLMMDKDATWVMLFNKKMIEEYQLDNPYDLVKNGTWTLDKFYEMMQQTGKDINGDGIYDDTDQYGLITQLNFNAHGFFVGTGERIVTKDKEDMPYLSMNSPRAVQAIEKIVAIQSDKYLTIRAEDWIKKYPNDTVWDGMQLVVFNTNRSLFYYAGMNRVALLRSMETPFGILPPPKLDATQEEYYTAVNSWCANAIAIPVSVTDIERTGIIVEAMAAESHYTLKPAYYDLTLKDKYTRDEESSAMLDIIFGNRVYDLAEVFNWGQLATLLQDLTARGSHDFSSQYAKKEKSAIREIEKTLKNLK